MARNFIGYARFAKACVQGNRTLIRQTIRMLIRIIIALAVMVSTVVPSPAAERSLGDALKKNALDLLTAAQTIINRGVNLWTFARK